MEIVSIPAELLCEPGVYKHKQSDVFAGTLCFFIAFVRLPLMANCMISVPANVKSWLVRN
jgi:hypothetical protein